MNATLLPQVISAIRAAGGETVPSIINLDDSLVLHLGFDSMKMAMLSLSLETEFGSPILLDGWIAAQPDPAQLTVRSLCEHMEQALGETMLNRTP